MKFAFRIWMFLSERTETSSSRCSFTQALYVKKLPLLFPPLSLLIFVNIRVPIMSDINQIYFVAF